MTKVTLEQWRVLQTVVDEGSFAKAAAKLHKSQSSISYTIAKLQDMLGVELLQQEGRKAVLTEHGMRIVGLSRQIIKAAQNLESSAQNFKLNFEKSLVLAIDEIFPPNILMDVLQQFSLKNNQTRLILNQGILSGPSDLLVNGEADLAIISKVPEGYLGDRLIDIHSIPYAHINSPLHQKKITLEDLTNERYIIVQDSGKKNKRNEGWLGSEFYWKVSSMESKIQCVAHGIGFSWLPKELVEHRDLPIKPLQLDQDNMRVYPLYLVHRNPQEISYAAQQLMHIFQQMCQPHHPEHNEGAPFK